MLIGSSPRITVEELLKWGVRFCALSFGSLLFAFFLLFSFSSAPKKIFLEKVAAKKAKEPAYASIGKGSLSLSAARSSHFLPWLGSEVLLLARNTRPDKQQAEASFLIGLKSTGEERVVKIGDPIFLLESEKEGKKSVRLSAEPTALWIKPLSFSRSQTTFEVGRRLEGEKEEKGQLVLNIATDPGKRALSLRQKSDAPFVRTLREAKHWSRDRLLEMYGGEEYRKLREKEKIQFMQDDRAYVCFVAAGDLLVWQEGRWRQAASSEISGLEPICQVKAASPRAVEIEAWDETGFYHLSQKVEAQFGAGSHASGGKENQLFTSIRMRNNSEVTCVAGKRRLVIREGDWLLKTASGWRNLRSVEQIEECVTHQLMGELFICDGFETAQGKPHMKGHFFDPMRTQMQTLSFPITAEKKSMKNKERRRRR